MAAGAVAAVCCLLALASGCGSSGNSSTSAGPPATATKTTGLKPNKAPRYASPPASAAVHDGVVQLAYRNIAIAPDTVRVRAGSTVRWTNYDAVEHNVTSDGGAAHFASRNFGEGKVFAVRLTRQGTVHYLCTIHPTTMNGTIEVVK
jgi:plastocyanin